MKYILLKSDTSKTQREMDIIGIYAEMQDVPDIKGTQLTVSSDDSFWENRYFEQEAKKEYDLLIKSGMFGEFFPKYSWKWEVDRDDFLEFIRERKNKHSTKIFS